jgi:O-antigen biosynthesis protein
MAPERVSAQGSPVGRQAFQALVESGRPAIAFIVHGWGGGIRRHVDDLAALVADQADVLFIEPASGDTVRVRDARSGAAAFFALPGEMHTFAVFLRALGVVRLHLHHVNGLPEAILDLLPLMRLPYDVTLHDYMTICPQLHLVAADGRYCGEPAVPGCTVCLNRRPPAWSLDIIAWRGRFAAVLRGASRVIAPSIDVAARIRRYVHHLDIEVWPHAEGPIAIPALARVATMGTLSIEKGLRLVPACAQDAHERSLALSYRILGAVGEPLPQLPPWRLSFTGEYMDAELPSLLAAEGPSVLWFPAQVPETYAYTLSAAIASGLPIVASDLGALRDRVEGRAGTRIVRWNATPAEWNEALIGLAPDLADRSIRVAEWPEHYRERYLAPLTQPPSGREWPELHAHHFEPPSAAAAPEMSLEALAKSGVLCGHTEARSELLRRASRVDVDFVELQTQVRTPHARRPGVAIPGRDDRGARSCRGG